MRKIMYPPNFIDPYIEVKGQGHVTCVGTPSGHHDQDSHDRSMYVSSCGGQSTAGLAMF